MPETNTALSNPTPGKLFAKLSRWHVTQNSVCFSTLTRPRSLKSPPPVVASRIHYDFFLPSQNFLFFLPFPVIQIPLTTLPSVFIHTATHQCCRLLPLKRFYPPRHLFLCVFFTLYHSGPPSESTPFSCQSPFSRPPCRCWFWVNTASSPATPTGLPFFLQGVGRPRVLDTLITTPFSLPS